MKFEEFVLDDDTKKLMRECLWSAMQRTGIKSPFPPPQRGTRRRINPVMAA